MKKLRVLVLMHEDLVPPDSIEDLSDKEIAPYKAEFDVVAGLESLGHEVRPLGVSDNLGVVRRAILQWKPHVAFNMLEEFHGVAVYDQHVVSYLELMRQPYTGCNPRGLMLAHDKALSKKILTYHRIATPRFTVFPRKTAVKRSRRLSFPLLVKSVSEDASRGISQASIVTSDEKLFDRVEFIHDQVRSDALAEEYVQGRELYLGVIGNQRLETFPVWEMLFTKMPEGMPNIATAKVKWDAEYQKKYGIETRAATNLPSGVGERIAKLCKRVYRLLSQSGYARMDLRLAPNGRIYVIEANPNPNLEYGEDFAESAHTAGIPYEALLQRILNLGRRYQAPWRG
ncbi:MAG: D-alanine--D-alanine ligase [Planctomycetota bacterium]